QLAGILAQALPVVGVEALPGRLRLPVLAVEDAVQRQGLAADLLALVEVVGQVGGRVYQAEGAAGPLLEGAAALRGLVDLELPLRRGEVVADADEAVGGAGQERRGHRGHGRRGCQPRVPAGPLARAL